MRKEYILEGLCCANCAAKIEKEVRALFGVLEANINLVNCKLSIQLADGVDTDLTQVIKQIVASHEPSVKVIKHDEDKEEVGTKQEKKETMDENKIFLVRLAITVVLTALCSVINIQDHIKIIVLAIAYLVIGYEVLMNAIKNILRGKLFDENFLMGFASLAAFIIGDQLEAISVLVFYEIGELLQDMAVNKSRKNIADLMDIRPDYANKMVGERIEVLPPEKIEVGDIILVKPGEKIPLDGMVVKGNSFIDTRALTGESVPREVTVDDMVLSGTISTNGLLEIKVTKPYGEATVSKILELVQNAGSKKAESEKFITRFANYYTPIVVILAIAVAVFPPLFGFGTFTQWLYRALSFLIISCPCALVISIPLSFFGGIGGGAKHGVLIKGGNYLDALKQVDTIVFDKTGTLTQGIFEVSNVCPMDGVDESYLVRMAAIAESQSTHPIAKSILAYYNNISKDKAMQPVQINELAGHGVVADTESEVIYAGNEKLMKQHNIDVPQNHSAGSIVHVAVNENYLGYILIDDVIKPETKGVMRELKQLGVKRTIMLTGDHEEAAKAVAKLCQVDEYQSELLPQDKVAWFDKYRNQAGMSGKIAFVGDGINDAPVLAGADIGIAMGGIGSDAAIEAADIVIMNDEIGKVVTAIKIARKTKKIVIQNIVFALSVKAIIMLLSFFGITSIWFAIFADVGVALLALLNALRAMSIK